MQSRGRALGIAVVGVGIALIAFLHRPGESRLVWPNPAKTTSFGAALHRVPTNQPYAFGVANVCVEGPSSVEVYRVSLIEAQGQQVQAFAVRARVQTGNDGTESLGVEPGRLSDKGFAVTNTPSTVGGHCYDGDDPMQVADGTSEVGIEIVRTSDATSKSKAVRIDYRAEGGRTDSLIIPFEITLCSPADRTTPDCQQPQP